MPNGQCFYKLYTNKWKNEKSYVKKSVPMLLVSSYELLPFQEITRYFQKSQEIKRNHMQSQDYTRNYKIIQEIKIN